VIALYQRENFTDSVQYYKITANNALAVLRYSIGMAGEDSLINKPIAA
jgi:hypothetical protein